MYIEPQLVRAGRSRGFTLLELLFCILIVGIAVAGITQVYAVASAASGDPLSRKQSLSIAEAMLEEVSLQAFSAPAAAYTGSNRAYFDHVAAYDGYASTGIRTLDGQLVSGLEGYRVAVTVAHPAAAIGGVLASDIWLITVTVSDAAGTSTVLSGYRFNYG